MTEQQPQQQQQTNKLSEVNKQILEIKKKIQLSEGQRKALFEECEAERKNNCEEILKLKKEIARLLVELHENKSLAAKQRLKNKRLAKIVGALIEKPCEQVSELLDLQIIDKNKQLDLLKYKIKKRQRYLVELGKEYQLQLSEKSLKEVTEKIDVPVKRATCDLQNDIHAVEVQLREATHIKTRYQQICKTLQTDGGKFESKIAKIQTELTNQNGDIERLQKVVQEAFKMRRIARAILLQEEKVATSSTNARDRKSAEGKKLLSDRKLELEKLEKRIFQGGKAAIGVLRQDPDGAEDDENTNGADAPLITTSNPLEALSEIFEKLKQITGASTTQEVLGRFNSQKDTKSRLMSLRKTIEQEKKVLEKKFENLQVHLERLKYAEVKEAERKSTSVDSLKVQIEKSRDLSRDLRVATQKKRNILVKVTLALQALQTCVNPLAIPSTDTLQTMQEIEATVKKGIQLLVEETIVTEETEDDDSWLPAPYHGLVRKTPLPTQPGVSPAPPTGSDDEEEVPSRGYLKRQAQLVIDAKSRKKNLRFQQRK